MEYREFNEGKNRVGEDGSVWSRRIDSQIWRQLKLSARNGRPTVIVEVDGIRIRRHVADLVLELFVGPRPIGKKAIHANGRKTDCRLINLSWGTRQKKGDFDEEVERDLRMLGPQGIHEVLCDYYGPGKFSKVQIGDARELEYRTVDFIVFKYPRPKDPTMLIAPGGIYETA